MQMFKNNKWWQTANYITILEALGQLLTSAKARLTSVAISVPLSVVGRWRNDVTVAMAMPAIVHAVQCSVAQSSRLIPLSVSPNSDESENNPCIHTVIWIATKILLFVHWPIANLPWKFHANPFGSFCAKLLTDRQTDKQRRLHILLGGGNNNVAIHQISIYL